MFSGVLLQLAQSLLEKDLANLILSIHLRPSLKSITLELREGIFGHVKYNDFQEYGYNITFSSLALDRCRFDNYDNLWAVRSRPHHFHPRYAQNGFASPMVGDPEKDIPMLCVLLQDGRLKENTLRF
jgi:hypothetical protein